MMEHGMGGGCSPEEKEAFKGLLNQVRSIMSMKGISEGGESEGKEDYLDPESLLAGKEDKGAVENSLDANEGDENESDMEDALESPEDEARESSKEPFDPKEAMDFFKRKVGSDRKPLKGVKIGMTEIAMSPKKRI